MNGLANLGWLIFRVGMGASLATHGWAKLFTLNYNGVRTVEAFARQVASMGFPFPLFFAYAAALSEFVGGVLIAVGLFGRVAGTFAGITMAVALYRHWNDPFSSMEKALLYLLGCAAVVLMGSGTYSLDHMIKNWRGGKGPVSQEAEEFAEEI